MAVGASTILGSFAARLGIDTGDYAKGIINAQTANSVFGQSFTGFIVNPLLGSIDLFKKAAAGAVRMGSDVLADAEAVQRLGQQTGATTELLQALAARMEVAGFNAEQGAKGLLVLGKNMAEARANGGPLAELFDKLGVSLAPGQKIDEGLAQLLDGLAALPDPSERSAIAMRLLGEEAGPRLVNAVGGGRVALAQMVKEGRQLGAVLGNDAVNQLADFNTTLGYTGLALENVKRNLVAQFLVGFIQEFGAGTDGVLDLAGALNDEVGPAMRAFGSDAGQAAGNVKEITEWILKGIEALKDWVFWLGEGKDALDSIIKLGALPDVGRDELANDSARFAAALRLQERQGKRFLSSGEMIDLDAASQVAAEIRASGAVR